MQRRMVVAVFGVVAAVAAGPSWACVPVQGTTWYADGGVAKSGSSVAVISAFATGARINLTYRLVSARPLAQEPFPGYFGCADPSAAPVNPTARLSNSRGFIPTTSGPVNRPPGDWYVCFKEVESATSGGWFTAPVFFTVI